jgi:hypothetical protein
MKTSTAILSPAIIADLDAAGLGAMSCRQADIADAIATCERFGLFLEAAALRAVGGAEAASYLARAMAPRASRLSFGAS